MNLIVAVDNNWGIGKDNQLLCHLPEDMKRFKNITKNHTIIMGRKTLESLPGGNPLKNRKNIVLTGGEINKDVIVCHNISEIFREDVSDAFVIGGGSVYKTMLPYCDTAYITRIKKDFDADTFFPELDDSWKLTTQSETMEYENIPYCFEIWQRKSNTIITLTDSEVKVAKFYLSKALIEAEGLQAIGMTDKKTVENLQSVFRKICFSKNKF